ncbi:unnamed protein product [Symbiodinium natans]|uniref:Uncharacterized protein n=1 Tax=Symbiodinium natans TaxID=878477 RepID=A0A812QNA4_9DINO|nr:unnamed protein product [Symbiodinium natans]
MSQVVKDESASRITRATAVAPGWQILPELRRVSVELVGSNQAAGAISDLRLAFVPESPAVAARLVAESPPDLSFDGSEVRAPASKGLGTAGRVIVLSGLSLVVGVEASVFVTSVQLGRGGGQTIFTLHTFSTSTLSRLADERLNFPGYFQAGNVLVEGSLQGGHASTSNPLLQNLPPRALEVGVVTLGLVFSLAVSTGDTLLVTCRGTGAYRLLVDELLTMRVLGFELSGAAGLSLPLLAANRGDHEIALQFLGAEGLNSTLIQSAQFAELTFQVLPSSGVNTWMIATYSRGAVSNTNDGNFAGFQPVLQLTVELAPERSPPNALIAVNLQVSSDLGPLATQLMLVAPPGFSFPTLCGELCSSFGEFFEGTGRPVASLLTTAAAGLLNQQLVFNIQTPLRTPQVLTWLVQAFDPAGNILGWGPADGFKVNQMRDAQVLYGGVPGLQNAQLAFVFTLETPSLDGTFRIVEVIAPSEILLSCDTLQHLTLPAAVCAEQGPGFARLDLDESLQPGTFSFTVTGDLPSQTPQQNFFSIVIRRSPSEHVVDAAFDFVGWQIQDVSISQPVLAWSTAGFREISTVTISFAVQLATAMLRALLISLPPGYQHRVRSVEEFKVSNQRLPLLKGSTDWLDMSVLDRILISLEPKDPAVDIGSYMFTFPVELPTAAQLPAVNLWQLSFCKSRYCVHPKDEAVLVSFPIAGFLPGEVSVLEQRRQKLAQEETGVPETASASTMRWSLALVLAAKLQVF